MLTLHAIARRTQEVSPRASQLTSSLDQATHSCSQLDYAPCLAQAGSSSAFHLHASLVFLKPHYFLSSQPTLQKAHLVKKKAGPPHLSLIRSHLEAQE